MWTMNAVRRRVFTILLVIVVAGVSSHAQDEPAVVKDFQNRVQQYASMKKSQGVPKKQTASPEKLAQEKRQATEKVHAMRPTAKQGDIFTPEIAAYFKQQLTATLDGPEGHRIRTSLSHAEPVPNLRLQVNQPYPKALPLQSTPPSLLLNLPRLPKDMQYRIVGSSLILYDESTRLIVDILPMAIRSER